MAATREAFLTAAVLQKPIVHRLQHHILLEQCLHAFGGEEGPPKKEHDDSALQLSS